MTSEEAINTLFEYIPDSDLLVDACVTLVLNEGASPEMLPDSLRDSVIGAVCEELRKCDAESQIFGGL